MRGLSVKGASGAYVVVALSAKARIEKGLPRERAEPGQRNSAPQLRRRDPNAPISLTFHLAITVCHRDRQGGLEVKPVHREADEVS